jgi:tRNA A-37 threonylcarbamoyl transferase component Bud32
MPKRRVWDKVFDWKTGKKVITSIVEFSMGDILIPDPDKDSMCPAPSPKKDEDSFLGVLEGIIKDHKKGRRHAPFKLMIPKTGEVTCTEIIQTFQNKRITCHGQSASMRMIVKLYYPRFKAYWAWRRSDRGYRAFLDEGVPAPRIIYSGYLATYKVYALVIEYLEGGVSLDLALQRITDEQEREALLHDFTASIAQHHEHGIIQEDLNLSNFMLREGCIYSIDGDLVKREKRPVGRGRSIGNLAHLFTAGLGLSIADFDSFIEGYTGKRNWVISTSETEKIREQILRIRDDLLLKQVGKVYRTRGRFTLRKEKGSFSVYYRINDSAVHHAIHEAAQRCRRENRCVGTAGCGLQTVGQENMMVSFSKGYGPLFMKRIWGACRVWENALMLSRFGMDIPQPAALVLLKRGLLQWDCFVFFRIVSGPKTGEPPTSDTISTGGSRHLASRIAEAYAMINGLGIRI